MKKQDRDVKLFVIQNAGKLSPAELATSLGIKERKVRKILEENPEAAKRQPPPVSSSGVPANTIPFQIILFQILFLFLWNAIIYSNSFTSEFHFDDYTSIINNHVIRGFARIDDLWFSYPRNFIPYFTYLINWQMAGLNVVPYHVFNFAVHALTGVAVLFLLMQLLKTPVVKTSSELSAGIDSAYPPLLHWTPFAAALIFLCHPIQTQAVTYIVQRNASIAALFFILSATLYLCTRNNKNFILLSLSLVNGLL